ncbi:hypothetical protein LCGC14_2927030, partial [marine sediment metagenome]
AEDVSFLSFPPEHMQAVRQCDGRLRVGALFGLDEAHRAAWAFEQEVNFLGIQYQAATLGIIRRAREAGMTVGVWTVNDPDDMKVMVALAPDAIASDRPDLLLKCVGGC